MSANASCSIPDKTHENSVRLPSFFVIGPPRTGTSWLHELLNPSASLPHPVKETRFFDLHFSRGVDWYLRYFPDHNGKPRGEVAPTYFASESAHERIARTVPHARVACIFRHPVERALSLYRLKRAYGMTCLTFEDAFLKDPELLESGKYATHLKKWQRTLGSKNVLVTFYEELRDHPQAYLDRLLDFIAIPRRTLNTSQQNLVHASETLTQPRYLSCTRIAVRLAQWLKQRHFEKLVAGFRKSCARDLFLAGGEPFSRISPQVSDAVLDTFRKEIEDLEAMMNCDLSAWKSVSRDFGDIPSERTVGDRRRRLREMSIPNLDEAGMS